MAVVTVTIDGLTVQVPAGTSVLDAAETIGIKIPALCYDPDLSSVGACRLCVVEIDGIRNLPTSCVTTCTDGMVVRTDTPAVMEARKTLLELLIANHPLDCMTCEKSGTCLLQKYCYEYGVSYAPLRLVQSGERLEPPLIKNNGEFKDAKEKYGSNAFDALSSARCGNEENYLLDKFTRAVIGANNIDRCARL